MAKIRVLGPRDRLSDALRVLQDFGLLQLADAPHRPGLRARSLEPREQRRRRQVQRLADDAQLAIERLGLGFTDAAVSKTPPTVSELAMWARLAGRIRRAVARIDSAEAKLIEERGVVERYRDLLEVLGPDLDELEKRNGFVTHAAVVPASERKAVERLAGAIGSETEQAVFIRSHALRSGDLVVLIVMPAFVATRVERLLADAHLPEVTLPEKFRATTLGESMALMRARLAAFPREHEALRRERGTMAREHGVALQRSLAAARDTLAQLDALEHCATTNRAFALEGWTPATESNRLASELRRVLGPLVAVEELATEQWVGQPAPVVLSNPRFFRPFEAIVRMMPLPRYGSIDPTPFVAVFFPLLFALMLADVGYGLVLLALGLVLHRRSAPGSPRRIAAEIVGPCAGATIIAGFLFGEFFGDVGHRLFGMRPLAFDRQESMVTFLAVAIGLGVVHVGLGLVLGVVAKWRHEPKHAVGSGVAALMVVFVILALLAAVEVLPRALLTPSVVALLIAFPVLVALEGAIAPVEFLSTLGNVLSYARVLAIGMASLMLAAVANQMAGAIGSTVVGVLFALLFHLVNFAIGIFSPTVHALRLHYVEFFGKFYSPGGTPYHPFGHWRPTPVTSS